MSRFKLMQAGCISSDESENEQQPRIAQQLSLKEQIPKQQCHDITKEAYYEARQAQKCNVKGQNVLKRKQHESKKILLQKIFKQIKDHINNKNFDNMFSDLERIEKETDVYLSTIFAKDYQNWPMPEWVLNNLVEINDSVNYFDAQLNKKINKGNLNFKDLTKYRQNLVQFLELQLELQPDLHGDDNENQSQEPIVQMPQQYSKQEIESYPGEYGYEGFYTLVDGDYFDQDGFYFDEDGFDVIGGYYDACNQYVVPEGFEYDDEGKLFVVEYDYKKMQSLDISYEDFENEDYQIPEPVPKIQLAKVQSNIDKGNQNLSGKLIDNQHNDKGTLQKMIQLNEQEEKQDNQVFTDKVISQQIEINAQIKSKDQLKIGHENQISILDEEIKQLDESNKKFIEENKLLVKENKKQLQDIYAYMEMENQYSEKVETLEEKVETLEEKVETLEEKVRELQKHLKQTGATYMA